MQVKTFTGSLGSKLLAILLAVALALTMMPLAMGSNSYAAGFDDWDSDAIALTFNGTEYTRDQVVDNFDSAEYTYEYESKTDVVKGVSLAKLLQDAKKKYAVDIIRANGQKAKADGKSVRQLIDENAHYILAYEVNGEPVYETKGTAVGCFTLYGIDNGEVVRDKMVNVITVTNSEPLPTDTSLTIKCSAASVEKKWDNLDALRNDPEVQAKVKTAVFSWKNDEDYEGTATVTGIALGDLFAIAGIKEDEINISSIVVEASDNWTKEYTADEILKPDIQGNTAMFAWTYDSSDKDKVETDQQRTIIGQFTEGGYNQSKWGKNVIKVIINGDIIPAPAPAPAVKDGQKATVSGSTYTVTSAAAGTVAFTKAKKAKTITIPATVNVNGKTLKVNKIAAKAFKGTKTKTIIVKTKALTKASVKGSLKGSKVKTVKVKVGSKKDNKKYVKKYRKIFKKKNSGKKVKVRR